MQSTLRRDSVESIPRNLTRTTSLSERTHAKTTYIFSLCSTVTALMVIIVHNSLQRTFLSHSSLWLKQVELTSTSWHQRFKMWSEVSQTRSSKQTWICVLNHSTQTTLGPRASVCSCVLIDSYVQTSETRERYSVGKTCETSSGRYANYHVITNLISQRRNYESRAREERCFHSEMLKEMMLVHKECGKERMLSLDQASLWAEALVTR